MDEQAGIFPSLGREGQAMRRPAGVVGELAGLLAGFPGPFAPISSGRAIPTSCPVATPSSAYLKVAEARRQGASAPWSSSAIRPFWM